MMTSRRFLFLVLALLIGCAVGDSPLHKVNEEEISQRRELWSFWDLLNLGKIVHRNYDNALAS
jgi:hypothetical protein